MAVVQGVAVVVYSSKDGISLSGPLSRQIEDLLLGTAPAQELAQVRGGMTHRQLSSAIREEDRAAQRLRDARRHV